MFDLDTIQFLLFAASFVFVAIWLEIRFEVFSSGMSGYE